MADSRDGCSFHLTGHGAKVFLQSPDIRRRGDELITGSDCSHKDMCLSEFGDRGVIRKTDQIRITVAVIRLTVGAGKPFETVCGNLAVVMLDQPGGNHLVQHMCFITDATRNAGENDFSDRITVQHCGHSGCSQHFSDPGFCDHNLPAAEGSDMVINFSHGINPLDLRL